MFGIKSKIANITASSSEVKKLQKTVQKAFSKNVHELQKFTVKEMPKVAQDYSDALKGLEQLSNNMRIITKK